MPITPALTNDQIAIPVAVGQLVDFSDFALPDLQLLKSIEERRTFDRHSEYYATTPELVVSLDDGKDPLRVLRYNTRACC